MLLLSKTFRASWSIGLAAVLLAAVPPGRLGRAENIVGGAFAADLLDVAASEGAFRHLRVLQDIASMSGGNRAAGTPGYDRSAEYVADRLKEAGYLVHFEEFEFPFFEERVPPVLLVSFPDGRQEPAPAAAFRTLTNSGSSNVTARLLAVNLGLAEGQPIASASGCKPTDFDEFERGFVALIRRGTCTFQTKVENARAAGAAGAVIMNEGTEGRTDAFSGQLRDLAPIPVVGVSYELGRSLDIAARAGATVRLDVNAVIGKRLTRNVLADTAFNSDSSLIIVGAHLTACRKDLVLTTMVAARLQCSKRRCDWHRGRPKPAVACASHSGAQRSAASSAPATMSDPCPRKCVGTSRCISTSIWLARPTLRASFRVPLRPVTDWLPWCDANSSLIFGSTT